MSKTKNKKRTKISIIFIVFLLLITFMNPQAYAWNITATRVTNVFESYEENPQIISDGSGGSIIVWEDQRSGSYYDIYAQKLDSGGNKLWGENGTKVSALSINQRYTELISDGAGGAIIVWENIVSLNVDNDIYAQRVDSSGSPLWTTNGIRIATESLQQMNPTIISDNAGGAIITWQDERTGNNQYDIYAQRLDQNGNALWTDNGSIVCNATNIQYTPQIVSDGASGAIISWGDWRSGNRNIYAQLLNSSGDSQWTFNGLPMVTHSAEQYIEGMTSDSVGSVIILWRDYRISWAIYAQRVNTTGIVQWGANGAPIVTTSSEKGWAELTGDGNGGAFIAWSQGPGNQEDLYAQYINSSGDLQWTSNGIEISTETRSQREVKIINDGVGGAIMVWQGDNRRGFQDWEIYAQRVESDGTTLWGGNGTIIDPIVNGIQQVPQLYLADVGVAMVTWQHLGDEGYEVRVQYFLDVENPSSNAPETATYEQNSTATIPWILTDNFAGGNYRVLKNGTDYISWANWTSGSNLNIPINTGILGVWNYTIQYNDTLGYLGIPNTVLISIKIDTNNPSSNSPGSATYEQGSTASIPWILTDNYAGGFYRVSKNGTEYVSWTSWTNGSNLNIPIITSVHGVWNYTIHYNDSLGYWGNPDTALISINKDTQNPSSNSPGSATYEQGSTASISWILTDNYIGGFYRVLKNGTEYISWTPWTSGSNLNILIATNILGDWDYTIQYNDSLGNWGIPNTVLISINVEDLPGSAPSVDGYNPLLLIGTIMIFFIIIGRKINRQRKK